MSAIAIIAGGVLRDSIRDRMGYGLVFFSVMLMASRPPRSFSERVTVLKKVSLRPRRRVRGKA